MAKLVLTKQSDGYWEFVLDGDIANAIYNYRNDLLVVSNQCHFKDSTGANLVKEQNISPTDVTIIDGTIYSPANRSELFSILKTHGYFDWIPSDGSGGGGGVDRFDELTDTFTYAGKKGMVVVVNDNELGLTATPFNNVDDTTDLIDMPDLIIPDQMLVSNADGTAYIFQPKPAQPETFLNSVGYFIYDDLATQTTPISLSNGVKVIIPNDGDGPKTDSSQAPFGMSKIWDINTNQINLSELSIGDTIDLRISIDVDASTNDQKYTLFLKTGIGSPSEIENVLESRITKAAGSDVSTISTVFAITDADTRDYPAEISIMTDANGTLKVYTFLFRVLRKNINIVQIGVDGLDLKEDKINKQPIVGNETSTVYYTSIKEVVDYVNSHGGGNLDVTLTKGNTSDQPMLLQKASDNYYSIFHPTYGADRIRTLFTNISGGATSTLTSVQRYNLWNMVMEVATAATYSSSSLNMLPSGTYIEAVSNDYGNGTTSGIKFIVISDGILIQKNTEAISAELRIALDYLTADRVIQVPDKDGTIALVGDIDTKLGDLTTDNITEGTNPARKYFDTARVLNTQLQGLTFANYNIITATDPINTAFGKLQAQINTPTITITVTTTMSNITNDANGVGQNGKNVIIDNGANTITYTVNGPLTASFVKHGTGPINFVQGSGRTLVQVDGSASLNGAVGSSATIVSIGLTDYLRVSNA